MGQYLALRSALVSLMLLAGLLFVWHAATRGVAAVQKMTPEYARLMGATATQGTSAMPGPLDVGENLVAKLAHPFYDNGPNDKGVGIQLAYSLARVMGGYLLAVMAAIPIGFLIGMSPVMNRALDPFIQVLKPVSPLAWMPLALYTIKDSSLSSIFVIFICSLWPMLINTAFGVASVRREWLNVARTLEVGPIRRASRSSCRRRRPPSSPACASRSASPGSSSSRPRCSSAAPASATSCGTSGTTSRSST
jgi:nitrate/nitrite transport system permease protein